MSATNLVDVLIIGAGPAGLEASLCLARHLKTAIVFSNNTFRNGVSKHMHMVPTWDHRDSADFRTAARTELLHRYKTITFQDTTIISITKNQEKKLFEAVDETGKIWFGRRLLLAHGMKDILPEAEFPGYTAAWGHGIYHCLFCHGHEERGSPTAGVLAWGLITPVAAREIARQARNLAQSVTIYTHGDSSIERALRELDLGKRISIDTRKITRIHSVPSSRHEGYEIDLSLEDGSVVHQGFLAHAPTVQLAAPFAEELGCELADDGVHVKVGLGWPETSVKGVFAAGDIANMAPSVLNALHGGQWAGVGLVSSLGSEEDERDE